MEQHDLDELLSHLEKPARYLGSEWNAVHKDWDRTAVRMAFAFPDLYEVGMSHLGLQILYGLVNAHSDYLMERVFAPAPDLEAELRRGGLPLFSLESHRPLRDFDLLGFTLQYELTFTNILNMIDLAGIPLQSCERSDADLLVIAGGPVAANPEPLAPFIDAFVIGEGEDALPEVLSVIRQAKESAGAPGARLRARWSRRRLLEKLAGIPGVYIPSFYSVEYNKNGGVQSFTALRPELQSCVRRRLAPDLNDAFYRARGTPGGGGPRAGDAGSLPWLHPGLPVLPGGDDLPPGAGARSPDSAATGPGDHRQDRLRGYLACFIEQPGLQ
jgi:radical SAM superfamily enzyme YgiQ (UPF0313 family)